MNDEYLIRTALDRSPGFSRSRRSEQDAAEAGTQPAKAGTPANRISVICATFYAGISASSASYRRLTASQSITFHQALIYSPR